MLADLPSDLLEELSKTALTLDREEILSVIGRIEECAPETAAHLLVLMNNFQTGRICELLGEVD